jgi:hypothetical protein
MNYLDKLIFPLIGFKWNAMLTFPGQVLEQRRNRRKFWLKNYMAFSDGP